MRDSMSRLRGSNRNDSGEDDYIKLIKSKDETIRQLKEIIDMIKRNNTSISDMDDDVRMKELERINEEMSNQVKQLKI